MYLEKSDPKRVALFILNINVRTVVLSILEATNNQSVILINHD